MNENEKKNGWLPILGYVALIVVLFIGIKVVFAGLGRAIPKTEDVQPQFTALNNREGQQVSYSLRLLTDEEMQSEEVQQWLDRAREQAEPDTGAYWLVRLEEDDYPRPHPGDGGERGAGQPAVLPAYPVQPMEGCAPAGHRGRTGTGGRQVGPAERTAVFHGRGICGTGSIIF